MQEGWIFGPVSCWRQGQTVTKKLTYCYSPAPGIGWGKCKRQGSDALCWKISICPRAGIRAMEMRALYVEDNNHVEDDRQDADLVRRVLLRATPAIEVDIATSATEAVQRLVQQPDAYQWILLHLPAGDGLQVLRHVREKMLPIAVIAIAGAITDSGNELPVMEAMKLGVDDYLIRHGNEWAQLPVLLHDVHKRLQLRSDPQQQPHQSPQSRPLHREELHKLTKLVPGVITVTRYPPASLRGKTLFASKSLWDMFELTIADVADSTEPFAGRVHADDIQRVNDTLMKIITTLIPINCEYRLVLSDGSKRWVESQVAPERDADGSVQLYSYTFDISDRKAAEQRLLKSESDLRKLTDQVPGVISVARHNADGAATILYSSSAMRDVFELDFEDVRNDSQPLSVLIHPDDRDRVRDIYRQMFRDVKRRTVEYRVILPKKGQRWLEWQVTPERQADGSVLMYSYVFDITERKAYEEAIYAAQASERANRAKTEFLSTMSHELRTPLNAVIGFSQLLQINQQQQLGEEQRNQVAMIEQAGLLLLGIINDVLDLSRIEAGNLHLSTEAVSINAMCSEVMGLVAESARKMDVSLNFVEAPKDVHILADPLRLKQVMVNLLSNAIKYNRAGGRVEVHIDAGNIKDGNIETAIDSVAIVVSDTGRGMNTQQLSHLFEPFNRLGAERTSVEGTGIGLVIVKKLMVLMHGELDVTSTPNAGSCFTLRLPVTQLPLVEKLESNNIAPTVATQNRMFSVLYAEDNEVNILVVRKILALLNGCDLRVARSGSEAIAMATRNPPDIMLLDMHLGDMNANEVADALDASEKLQNIPRIVLSADALPEHSRIARERGFSAYLTKPVQVSELLACIERYLPLAVSQSS